MAVAREVKEESGVAVDPDSIQYEASQPWPFPQSLMIGFQAQAKRSTDMQKRDAELEQLKVGAQVPGNEGHMSLWLYLQCG